tara:strand:- start:2708 stop:3061 length:354 start_codon:yes stop_codon:yes gene_type:complete
MAKLTINITTGLNKSLAVGDTIFKTDDVPSSSGGFNTSNDHSSIGTISKINSNTQFEIGAYSGSDPGSGFNGDFVFFAKDNKVNTSGIIGSFAEVKFVNDSTSEAKLFAVNAEIVNS